MQENAWITAEVFGERLVGFFSSNRGTPTIRVPDRGEFKIDPDTIRYLGEPE